MRDHDTGSWRFAHTIGLIQHTKAAHCVEEMWAIAEMNSNWKVWMASLIKSKHAERQIIFWSRLFMLVLVGRSHCFHVWESCQLQNYCSGSFFVVSERKRSLFVYLPCCQGTNELSPPMWGFVVTLQAQPMPGFHGDGGVKCALQPGCTVWVAIPFHFFVSWPFSMAATNKSIQPGARVHVVNSYKLQHSLQSSSGLFWSRDGKAKGKGSSATRIKNFGSTIQA